MNPTELLARLDEINTKVHRIQIEAALRAAQTVEIMQAGLISTKKAISEAIQQAGEVSDAARATADLAISKKKFAKGILDISQAMVMSPKMAASAISFMDS
ncbi:hypothetical protein N657DRAFT_684185 [Parathielavia appendiculata]|uniref:Uncharacterized protein n=1 Tax=Parathielavia appendiculata TaxID=2587402 RepID=A0AAN6TTD4_9PEZI|nr:hypothetical protein N657DRAFT_684185 [Parathielavia appendiculata]